MLKWYETDAVEIAENIELPQFDLLNATTMKCDAKKYKTGTQSAFMSESSITK